MFKLNCDIFVPLASPNRITEITIISWTQNHTHSHAWDCSWATHVCYIEHEIKPKTIMGHFIWGIRCFLHFGWNGGRFLDQCLYQRRSHWDSSWADWIQTHVSELKRKYEKAILGMSYMGHLNNLPYMYSSYVFYYAPVYEFEMPDRSVMHRQQASVLF